MKTWTAAAWWLERRHRDEFALPTRLEHSGPDSKPIQIEERKFIDLSGLTQEQLENIAKALSQNESPVK